LVKKKDTDTQKRKNIYNNKKNKNGKKFSSYLRLYSENEKCLKWKKVGVVESYYMPI
jgi:hypothetical protein